MIKAGIIGATGYTGAELMRILIQHPEADIVAIGARNNTMQVGAYHTNMYQCLSHTFCDIEIENFKECDVVFLALPHGTSSIYAKQLIAYNIKVIDLGADFRLNDIQSYKKWYGDAHEYLEMLPQTVYGLPEIKREQIKHQHLIANPGCFPTSIILGIAPLCTNNLLEQSMIVVDSVSGLSGAGKQLSEKTHFINVNNNVNAYSIGCHRHLPEIIQEIEALSEGEVEIVFTPHLIPINRGILSTITLKLSKDMTQNELNILYQAFYQNEYFVRIREENTVNIRDVVGSNFCDISIQAINDRTVVITSAIDNLMKGASGQAVQNMNILFDLEETMGLDTIPLWP